MTKAANTKPEPKSAKTSASTNAKPRKSPSKSSTSVRISRKKAFGTLALLFIILAGVWWFFLGGSTLSVQRSLESYLEEKYDKDFVVERPEMTGSGIGMPGSWRAQSHPRDDPTLMFEVGKDADEEHKDRFFDYYTGATWSREEEPKVKTFLGTLYGETIPDFRLQTHIATAASPDPIQGAVPPIDSAIKQYGENFYYGLTLMFSTKPLSSAEKEVYKSKFRTIAAYVKDRGAKKYSLRFAINLKDSNTSYICDTGYYQSTDIETELKTCLDNVIKNKAW